MTWSDDASVPPVGEDDLQAFIDDRLTPGRRALVVAYLAAHPEIEARVGRDRQYRDALSAQLAGKVAEPIPARLRVANLRPARRDRRHGQWHAAAILVAFCLGGGGGWLAGRMAPNPDAPGAALTVARDAGAAYRTFVVEVAHPVEVDASHEAHLLQWLSKRLGRPLAAPDLAAFGYRLMGGRLLPGEAGAAAQLMYEDPSGRRLTLYVAGAEGGETAFRFQRQGADATFAWIDQGFGFAVTAKATRDELLPIAEAVYRRFDGG